MCAGNCAFSCLAETQQINCTESIGTALVFLIASSAAAGAMLKSWNTGRTSFADRCRKRCNNPVIALHLTVVEGAF